MGGTSEHKEGRAWDWMVSVSVPSQKAAADSLLEWLTEEDRYGNDAAMARRLGIMYIIWDREIWGAWGGGWRTYCVQKADGCKEPGRDGGLRHPHTDHVHFSFTWDGAKKKTSYWRKDMSFMTAIAASEQGYWALGRNGSVASVESGFYGHQADKAVKHPVVDIAVRPGGDGYWLLSSNGKIKAFGSAPFKGSPKGDTEEALRLAVTPSGSGYWVVSEDGQVFAFGKAQHYGELSDGSTVVGIAPTATGLGYWLVTRSGKVSAFGDAVPLGDAPGEVAGIAAAPAGLGYWLFTRVGGVQAFGDAADLGDLGKTKLTQDIVDMAPTATGAGYRLLGSKGKVAAFGDAPAVTKRLRSFFAASTPPQAPAPQVMPGD